MLVPLRVSRVDGGGIDLRHLDLDVARSSPSRTEADPFISLKAPVTLETVRWRILNWMLE